MGKFVFNKNFLYLLKRITRVLIDTFLFSISLIIAYKLRLEHNLSTSFQSWYWNTQLPFVLFPVVTLKMFSLFIFKIYRKMWRYTEVGEILQLSFPIFLSSAILALPRFVGFSAISNIFAIPTSIIIIDTSISIILLSCIRILRKWQVSNREIRKRKKLNPTHTKKRTLLIGAGQAAQELIRKIQHHPELDINIVCALDDADRKQKIELPGNIKVVGKINALSKIISKSNIEQIIIAIPSLSPTKVREIVELCQSTNLETKIIPGVDQLADGRVQVEHIRKVSLEDLLGREPVDLSIPEIANFINNKTILITGAGGSIGSELTKQLVKNFHPKELIILGRGENSIFTLSQELSRISNVPYKPVICDIRNYKHLYNHISKFKPQIIFHAAAHKHVPLMEDHPKEAFENNVLGTKNLAEISGVFNVETFINISTDKAVNPINVLGYTKRLSELAINALAKKYPETKYVSVRFGNVIGSRGSVIPIWEWQIKNNLPITVTHKDAYRFFMTITEAAQLVIKASAIGNTSEIIVLDMGNEINIYTLVRDFIKLAGYNFDEVKINFTGLRPGEKLKEELVGYYEGTNLTKHKKILVIESKEINNTKAIDSINDLVSSLDKTDDIFKEMISETITALSKDVSLAAI